MNEQGEIENCREYMEKLSESVNGNRRNLMSIYGKEEGAKRFAHEFGYGVPDSPKYQWDDVVADSYEELCVPFYDGRCPIEEKVWSHEVWKAVATRCCGF